MGVAVTAGMSIILEWDAGEFGPVEIRSTMAQLRIDFGELTATRAEDDWSQSVHSWARLSAYPLALWFASSWWRLRWESAPLGRPNAAWRMAHEIAGAGGGFVWPTVRLTPDGEMMEAVCSPSPQNVREPLRYLASFTARVLPPSYERAIDDFIASVLERLDVVGARDTELHALWQDLWGERTDPPMARLRQLEARLGFEPGEAPETVLTGLQALSVEGGSAAVAEVATSCAGDDPSEAFSRVAQFVRSKPIRGRLPSIDGLAMPDDQAGTLKEPPLPWERGRSLARTARKYWNISSESIEDHALSELLGISQSRLRYGGPINESAPLGLAMRRTSVERVDLLFRTRRHTGRRFEAARFLADHLMAPSDDRWLPATDARTARQQKQRAFAAEFLCPIHAVESFLNEDYSQEAIERAAEHFGVSPLTMRSHLANNDRIERFPRPRL